MSEVGRVMNNGRHPKSSLLKLKPFLVLLRMNKADSKVFHRLPHLGWGGPGGVTEITLTIKQRLSGRRRATAETRSELG